MKIILYVIVACFLGGCALSPPPTPSGDPIELEEIPYIVQGAR